MLRWNPQKRPTAQQALRYSFFQVGQNMQRSKVQTQHQSNKQGTFRENTIDKKPNPMQEVKPLNLNASMSKPKNVEAILKPKPSEEPRKPEPPKNARPEPPKNQKTMTPRRRWGGSAQQSKPAPKDSVDEFESILDGLGNSTTNFNAANKRVSLFLLVRNSTHAVFSFLKESVERWNRLVIVYIIFQSLLSILCKEKKHSSQSGK